MKKVLSVVLALLLLAAAVPLSAMTASAETYDVFTYSVTDGLVTITDCDSAASGDVVIPAEIDGCPVTSINNTAFQAVHNITSVTIPESVTSISCEYAFSNSNELVAINVSEENENFSSEDGVLYNKDKTKLLRVPEGKSGEYIMPDSVTQIGFSPLRSCEKLTAVTISGGMTDVPSLLFEYCTGIETITIHEGVTKIASSAFNSCSALMAINVSEANESFSSEDGILLNKDKTELLRVPGGISGEYVIPESVTKIGGDAFDSCAEITEITIPSGASHISSASFGGCKNLKAFNVNEANETYGSLDGVLCSKDKTKICIFPFGKATEYVIPDCVTTIDANAFSYIYNLRSVTIPDTVTEIGELAFGWCYDLEEVILGKGLTAIPDLCFFGCTNLERADLPDTVTSIGANAFQDCALFNVNIPNGVESIEFRAFSGCPIKSIEIPDTVTSIGYEAFAYCSRLEKVTIPSSVTLLYYQAFSHCTALRSITIPETVTSIPMEVFAGCKNLTICGKSGSKAEEHAQEYGIPFVALDKIKKISVTAPPEKTVYPLYGYVETSGLVVTAEFVDNTTADVTSACAIEPYVFSTAGEKTITVSFDSFSAEFNVTVDAELIEYPESEHPYAPGTDKTWKYTHRNPAEKLLVTFSEDTEIDFMDRIYIYAADGSLAQLSREDEVSSKTVEIPGNEFEIRLDASEYSDGQHYGFKITDIVGVISRTENGVTVIAGDNALPADARLSVEIVEDDVALAALPEGFNRSTALTYDIAFKQNGEELQPNAAVNVTIPVPEGVNGEKCRLFHINGEIAEDMNAVFEDGVMKFAAEHFSRYVLADDVFSKTVIMKKGQTFACVNGKLLPMTDYGDGNYATAKSVNGSYALPLRCVGEAFNMRVDYLGSGKTKLTNAAGEYVVVTRDSTLLEKYDADNNLINSFTADFAAFTDEAGITYVPMRAVSEALGLGVSYVGSGTTGHGSYVAVSTDLLLNLKPEYVLEEIEKAYALGL